MRKLRSYPLDQVEQEPTLNDTNYANQQSTTPFLVVSCFILAAILLIVFKRRALRPGSWLQKNIKRKAQCDKKRRTRRILAMLNDPLLASDLEARLVATLGSEELAKAEMVTMRERALETYQGLELQLSPGQENTNQSSEHDDDYTGTSYVKSISRFLCRTQCFLYLFFSVGIHFLPVFGDLLDLGELEAPFLVGFLFFVLANTVDNHLIITRFGNSTYTRCGTIKRILLPLLQYSRAPTNDPLEENVSSYGTSQEPLLSSPRQGSPV
jgi:hypothetical protein